VSLNPNAGNVNIARKKERKEKKKALVTGDKDDVWILDQALSIQVSNFWPVKSIPLSIINN